MTAYADDLLALGDVEEMDAAVGEAIRERLPVWADRAVHELRAESWPARHADPLAGRHVPRRDLPVRRDDHSVSGKRGGDDQAGGTERDPMGWSAVVQSPDLHVRGAVGAVQIEGRPEEQGEA